MMQNQNTNNSWLNNRLKKFILIAGATGVSALIGLPVLSQSYYPIMAIFVPTAYPNYPQRNEDVDIAAVLEKDAKFKNLAAEIEAAGLTEQLKEGQHTLIAPSNEAFEALSEGDLDKMEQTENGLRLMEYHLISGVVTEANIKKGEVTTLSGETIAISSNDDGVMLNNAQALFPSTQASNGVIIEVDQVLLPPDF